jgi:F-type H+-transporting ATPase subunit epsilon
MADTFELEIATPNRLLVREQVSAAQIPAANGYIGVLPAHAPLLSLLGTGELTYVIGGRESSVFISGGFVEVLEDHVRVLADRAEKAEEIDQNRAKESLKRAEELLKDPREQNVDIARALNAASRAQARLKAARHK